MRILLQQNTALLSHVCQSVTAVTSQVLSIIWLFRPCKPYTYIDKLDFNPLLTVDQKWYSQVFTVDQRLPILQFFYQRWFEIIDRRSEMILTTDVRPSLPRFTLISPNWLLICALTVFEIKIYFHFVIPCSKCPWYQYWCALQQYLMSILGITFPCQFRCSSWLAWFNLEISAIIMHLFSSTFHHTFFAS